MRNQPQRVPRTPTKLEYIPSGRAGMRATLRKMAQYVRDFRADYRIREKALELVRYLPEKNWIAEAEAIHRYVRDRIRYVKDPVDLETIAEPWKTIEIGQGDCDDKVVLAAALLHAIGHPARFLAVTFDDGQAHVLVETLIGSEWYPMELTERGMCLGEYPIPERIVDYMIEHISLR